MYESNITKGQVLVSSKVFRMDSDHKRCYYNESKKYWHIFKEDVQYFYTLSAKLHVARFDIPFFTHEL